MSRASRRLLLALALAASPAGAAEPGPEARVRIVLVTLDTLRGDGFAGAAGAPSAMPRTRAYAGRGLVFDRFYAASSATQPTHASLFTGLHPWEHGVVRNGAALAERHVTLAERLRDAGFATAAVVASFPLLRRFGFAQGFEVYRDEFRVETPLESWEDLPLADRRFYSLADPVTETALVLLDASTAPRQFYWIHYFDPHDPYGDSSGPGVRMELLRSLSALGQANLPAVVARARRLYAEDLDYLDRALARLFERLDADAFRYQTHIVVTSDHGESFGERRVFGHGTHVTPEQVHVPCFAVSPRITPGTRLDTAGSVDVPATILALAGLAAPRGRDLVRPGGGPAAAVGMGNLGWTLDPETGERVRQRPRFFLVQDGVQYTGDPDGVFLEDDPARPASGPGALGAREAFGGFLRALAALGPEAPLGEEEREGLRALGYAP